MPHEPLIIGEYVYHWPDESRRTAPIIFSEQRRYSRDGKMILDVVHCPYCEQYHEHGEVGQFLGFDVRGANCGGNSYFLIQCDEPPVPASTPRPKLKRAA